MTNFSIRRLASISLIHAVALGGLSALPVGEQLISGQADFVREANRLTVSQASGQAIIHWQDFSIGAGNVTRFVQPDGGVALNRVIGGIGSLIAGRLEANGSIILVNPSGITVGNGGVIQVQSFIGTTLDVTDEDFLNGGGYLFSGSSNAQVVNLGRITAVGDAFLIAREVVNRGTVEAGGTVGLAGATEVLVQSGGDQDLYIRPGSALGGSVEHSGTVRATVAEIRAAGNPYALAINLEGVVESTLRTQVDAGAGNIAVGAEASVRAGASDGGEIMIGSLQEGAGSTAIHGLLDASGEAGTGGTIYALGEELVLAQGSQLLAGGTSRGGFIETSGRRVDVGAGIVLPGAGGTWLVDPVDLQIDAGNVAGFVATLNSDANVILDTNQVGLDTGNIAVNVAVSWTGTGTLSLLATNDIAIYAAISGLNGGLVLNAGGNISADSAIEVGRFDLEAGTFTQIDSTLPEFYAEDFRLTEGSTFVRALGGAGTSVSPYQLADVYGLQGMDTLRSFDFVLANDIDASSTRNWNDGAGWVAVGNSSAAFTGSLAGDGHVIQGLYIYRPEVDDQGLFGRLNSAEIRGVGLTDLEITGNDAVGGLVAYSGVGSSIYNSYVIGTVTGESNVGGLVGALQGSVEGSYSAGFVNGEDRVGGLIGSTGTYNNIRNSFSSSVVTGTFAVGGLVGVNYAYITNSYASGSVTGGNNVGGLVGSGGNAVIIESSYASGAVTGTGNNIGGLTGSNHGNQIYNSYATGSVTGVDRVGGLVGDNWNGGSVHSSYASGLVTGTGGAVGGLIGRMADSGTLSNNFWDVDTTGQTTSAWAGAGLAEGLTTAELLQLSTYANAGWDIGTDHLNNTWVIFDGQTRPILASEYSTTIRTAHQLQLMGLNGVTRSADYTLVNDLDLDVLNSSRIWGTRATSGEGWVPVGNSSTPFGGSLTGNGHLIQGLYIQRPGADDQGLFGNVEHAVLNWISLEGVEVTGGNSVGSLAGINSGSILHSYSTGQVTGGQNVGGLVGSMHATGSVSSSYASVGVVGSNGVGGLVGNSSGNIVNSYATGSVAGGFGVGGLVGFMNYVDSTVVNSYATGAVTGSGSVGGLVGLIVSGTLSNNFWDTQTTGQMNSSGMGVGMSEGLTTAEFQNTAGFMVLAENWDFEGIWVPSTEGYYPELYFLSAVVRRDMEGAGVYGDTPTVTHDEAFGGPALYQGGNANDQIDWVTDFSFMGARPDAGIHQAGGTPFVVSRLGQAYRVVYVGEIEITPRAITLSAVDSSKVYGNSDGSYEVSVTGGALGGDLFSDSLADVTGTLSRSAGEDVGSYNILLGSGAKAGNFTITFNEDNDAFTITPRAIILSAVDSSKVYGNSDGSYEVSVTGGALGGDLFSDSLADVTGTLSRSAGEDVGSYNILLGSGAKAGNFTITFDEDNDAFTITPRAITLSAVDSSKVYGNSDGSYEVSVTGGALGGDLFSDSLADVTGTLSRSAGEDVGSYNILLGSGAKAGNFTITFDEDNDAFTITPRAITLSAVDSSKVYGNSDGSYEVSVTGGALGGDLFSDSLADVTGTLSRSAGEDVGSYNILLGSGAKAGNFTITFDEDNDAFTITPRAITLSAVDSSKVYGNSDGSYEVSVTGGALGGDLFSDSLADVTGTLSRSAGEDVGSYNILLGSGAKAGNFTITFDNTNGAFTITPRELTITALDQSKTEGDTFVFNGTEFTVSNLAAWDDVQGAQISSTGANGAAFPGQYSIEISDAYGHSFVSTNYQISYMPGQFTVNEGPPPPPGPDPVPGPKPVPPGSTPVPPVPDDPTISPVIQAWLDQVGKETSVSTRRFFGDAAIPLSLADMTPWQRSLYKSRVEELLEDGDLIIHLSAMNETTWQALDRNWLNEWYRLWEAALASQN